MLKQLHANLHERMAPTVNEQMVCRRIAKQSLPDAQAASKRLQGYHYHTYTRMAIRVEPRRTIAIPQRVKINCY